MLTPRVVAGCSLLSLLLAACGGGNTASLAAKVPTYDPTGQTKCSVEKSQAKPLIVEWPSADRGELEAQAHARGLVVVRYSGCEMQVLDCTTPVKYGYLPITRKKDHVTMRDADDLYANVPVGAARLEAKLEKSGELDVDMTMVGRWEAERRAITTDELQGSCDGATHVVSAFTVGAFTFTAGADARVGGGVTVMGAGGGAESSAKRETLNADGDEAACERATPDDKGPPAQCGALIRIEVVPLTKGSAGTAAVLPPEPPRGISPVAPLPPPRKRAAAEGGDTWTVHFSADGDEKGWVLTEAGSVVCALPCDQPVDGGSTFMLTHTNHFADSRRFQRSPSAPTPSTLGSAPNWGRSSGP